jgi:hypothetical protein
MKHQLRLQSGPKEVLGVLFTNISHGHNLHQWWKLLACSASKASLIKFLTTDWQKEILCKRLGNKELYVTCDYMCIRMTCTECEDEIVQPHKTRLTLAHIFLPNMLPQVLVIVAEDTAVLILSLAFNSEIQCTMSMKWGTRNRTSYINVTKVGMLLGDGVCKALIGLHAFTGCDPTSVFAGKSTTSGLTS